jgi:hypothetical protein
MSIHPSTKSEEKDAVLLFLACVRNVNRRVARYISGAVDALPQHCEINTDVGTEGVAKKQSLHL